jgi:Tfp pilus assembly protein PilF
MDALWPDGFVEEANLTQHIYVLRRAFREHGAPEFIETAPRRGYRFCAPPEHRRVPRRVNVMRFFNTLAAGFVLLLIGSAAVFPSSPPLTAEAMHAYTLGRYFWNLRSVSGMQQSIGYFQRTIRLAPHSPLGYAALADAYTELADFQAPCEECGAWRRGAEQWAVQALRLGPSSAEAHVAYGMVRRVFYGDEAAAAREFRAALQLDPRNALANQWYGNMLIAQGRTDEGVRRLQLASQEQPVATATYAWLARGYYYQHRYAQAAQYARQALALEPTRLETTVLLGLAEEARGNFWSARVEFQRARRLGAATTDVQALLAGVQAAMGRRNALSTLHSIAARRDLDVYTARDVVIGLALAGDVREARRSLSRMRYRTVLDRELIVHDPHISALL